MKDDEDSLTLCTSTSILGMYIGEESRERPYGVTGFRRPKIYCRGERLLEGKTCIFSGERKIVFWFCGARAMCKEVMWIQS